MERSACFGYVPVCRPCTLMHGGCPVMRFILAYARSRNNQQSVRIIVFRPYDDNGRIEIRLMVVFTGMLTAHVTIPFYVRPNHWLADFVIDIFT
jgi:hypothetical protein